MRVRHWSLSPDLRSAIIISVSLVRTNKGCTRACEVREMAEKKDFDVSDLVEVSNATVHGVAMEVSPVRPSRKNPEVKYFSGKLSDGQKVVRMISFEPKLRPVLDKSREERKPVALVNCKVSESKFESGFEIMTSGRMVVKSFTVFEPDCFVAFSPRPVLSFCSFLFPSCLLPELPPFPEV